MKKKRKSSKCWIFIELEPDFFISTECHDLAHMSGKNNLLFEVEKLSDTERLDLLLCELLPSDQEDSEEVGTINNYIRSIDDSMRFIVDLNYFIGCGR